MPTRRGFPRNAACRKLDIARVKGKKKRDELSTRRARRRAPTVSLSAFLPSRCRETTPRRRTRRARRDARCSRPHRLSVRRSSFARRRRRRLKSRFSSRFFARLAERRCPRRSAKSPPSRQRTRSPPTATTRSAHDHARLRRRGSWPRRGRRPPTVTRVCPTSASARPPRTRPTRGNCSTAALGKTRRRRASGNRQTSAFSGGWRRP